MAMVQETYLYVVIIINEKKGKFVKIIWDSNV